MGMFFFIALASIAAAAAANAEGCQGAHDPVDVVQSLFDDADRDGDGGLTQSEYEAAGLQQYGVTFEESDTNADGTTTLAEYLELYRRHHASIDDTEV